jgi:glutamate racemase
LQRHGIEAFEKACPLFVPLVEEGLTEHPVTEQVARIYLGEALAGSDGADVLVLACTHYPLIAPVLRRTAPEQMTIVDSAESTASVVKKIVEGISLRVEAPAFMRGDEAAHNDQRFSAGPVSKPSDHRSFQFFVTDSVDKFKKLAARFLGRQVDRVEHVDLGG